jgi:2-oxoglutarate dehydrogenase E1 component
MITQPLMYKRIREHPGTRALYAERLQAAKVITPEESEAMINTYRAAMDKGYHTNTTVSNYKTRSRSIGPNSSASTGPTTPPRRC